MSVSKRVVLAGLAGAAAGVSSTAFAQMSQSKSRHLGELGHDEMMRIHTQASQALWPVHPLGARAVPTPAPVLLPVIDGGIEFKRVFSEYAWSRGPTRFPFGPPTSQIDL
jgi:hypothetical protein